MKSDPDNWHVEVHYSRWRRIKRFVYANRGDILFVVGGIIVVGALLIMGPPVCGGMT